MLKILTTLALSLLLLFPTMAQEMECVTPDAALQTMKTAEPTINIYELDRKYINVETLAVFYAAPTRSTLLMVIFDRNNCFSGVLKEITKEDYRTLTGKVFVDASA